MGADSSRQNETVLLNPDLKSLSNFSPNYILKLKERFDVSDQNNNGYELDKKAAKDFFKCSDREIKVLFDLFDMDESGTIDSYEFTCCLAMMADGGLNEKAELIFKLYDFDKSGSISKEELTVMMTNVLTSLHSMKKKPAPKLADIERKTNEFFTKSDVDRNNLISLDEFKNYIKTDLEILKILDSYGLAKSEDLGKDFGDGEAGVPELDDDLAEEACPRALQDSNKKLQAKIGAPVDEFGMGELEEGDQFMAVKPWKGVVDNSVPDGYKPSRIDEEAPDASLDLDYVFGYRCHDARNNLRYNCEGKLVYHCAGVGVVMDKKTNTQKFFMNHNDDIHCLALHPDGKVAATGQIGPKPRLCIWDTTTMEQIAMITTPLTKGIKNIAFSPNGKFLTASDLSPDHIVAVWDWQAKPKGKSGAIAPIASGVGSKADIFSIGFNDKSDTIVATCNKEVKFLTWTGGKISAKKGTGMGLTPGMLCQAFVGGVCFIGTQKGEIVSWQGTGVSKRTPAHTGMCRALYAAGGKLISGGDDGLVTVWNVQGTAITKAKDFDTKAPEIMSMKPMIRSVCQAQSGEMLVGTRGGEIIEFSTTGAASLFLRSHFDNELWGLAMHPNKAEMYTFGQDCMLAVWDMKTHRQIKHCKLETPGNALAFSHDASKLVLGFNNGVFMVLDQNFKPQTKRKDRAGKEISVIRFSPNDSICAIGGNDSIIITYDVKNNFKGLRKMRGHSSRIKFLDFSLDGATIKSTCQAYEILFFNCSTGKQWTSGASGTKNEQWETYTSSLGWHVQGIWEGTMDGSDINAVERSPDGTVLASADDFGLVKLFRYPCPVDKGAAYNKFTGHSSHVTNVSFSRNKTGQKYLLTTGGEDKCIFQWKYFLDNAALEESMAVNDASEDIADDWENEGLEDGDQNMPEMEEVKAAAPKKQQVADEFGFGGGEMIEEADQRLAVLPFKGDVESSWPSNYVQPKNSSAPPDANLTLQWANGFRSFDSRNNLKYTASNEVLFCTAGVGVVLNPKSVKQRFFNKHREDIVALALHPDGDIVATGQMAGKELNEGKANAKINAGAKNRVALRQGKLVDIFVWRASTCEVIAQIKGVLRRAVRQLAFNKSGNALLGIGEDDNRTCAVYDWQNSALLGSEKVDPGPVFDAKWKNDKEFATCGAKHVKMFSLNGSTLKSTRGVFSRSCGNVQMTAMGFSGETMLTGTSKGGLVKWGGSNAGKPIQAHQGVLYAIEPHPAGGSFFTGGRDGMIVKWDASFKKAGVIDINPHVQYQGGVKSFDIHPQSGNFLVGTRGSDIVEVSSAGALVKNHIQGHFQHFTVMSETWGLAAHPSQNKFASCGGDKTVRVWGLTGQIKCSEQFSHDVTALDWSQDGSFIAVGDRNGTARLLDAESLVILGQLDAFNAGKRAAWIEDIKISPDNSMVAFGTHGGASRVEIGRVDSRRKLSKLASVTTGISSALSHLDWSIDSQHVVINSQAYEIKWLNIAQNGSKISTSTVYASAAKDIQWATWTSTLGFGVQGIWPGIDYTDVKTTCRSRDGTVLATGDDFGQVKLFKYPCVDEKASNNAYDGHSSFVTKVRFSHNDGLLFSTGGNDKTVMVWATDLAEGNEFESSQKEAPEYEYNPDDPDNDDFTDYSKVQKADAKKAKRQQEQEAMKAKAGIVDDEFGDEFGGGEIIEGTEFMAVRPWLGQMREPTGFSKPPFNQNKAPAIDVELEWIHGYRGSNAKNNLKYVQDGQVAYFAAGCGVVYDPASHTQKHFNHHHDDVTSMAFHPNLREVATAENGRKPSVFIWDTETMQTKFELKGNGIVRNVMNLAYSPSGDKLAVVDMSDDHNIAIYDSQNGSCIAKSKGDRAKIIEIAFRDETSFVTVGSKHFKNWTISASTIKSRMGNFGKNDQRIGSVAFNGQTALTGAIDGSLYCWNGTSVGKVIKNHTRLIDAIDMSQGLLFTGGRDQKISVLDPSNYAMLFSIDCSTWGSINAAVRSIDLNAAKNQLIVGTFGHEVWQVPFNASSKQVGKPSCKIHGHYAPLMKDNNEVWGCCPHPMNNTFFTVSDDATLRHWDAGKKVQLKAIDLTEGQGGAKLADDPKTKEHSHAAQGRSVDVSPKGDFVAVGMRDGTLRVYNTKTYALAFSKKISKMWIEDLKFSPDGSKLVVGAHDSKLYFFDMPSMTKTKAIKVSSSAITHIDWSEDSQTIRTNDTSYEILYINVASGTQDKSGASNYRNENWATATVVLSWASQGIWQPGQDGTDINMADRSHGPVFDGMQLLATADDFGKVNLYRYPSPSEHAQCLALQGHSSHVTKVRWNHNDTYLFSTGGNDTAVMQWRVTKK